MAEPSTRRPQGAPRSDRQYTTNGVRPADAEGRVGGYSVLRADDMDAAVALVRDHPFVKRGGSLQVTEAVAR